MQATYFRLIDLLASRYDRVDFLRELKDAPRVLGRRKRDGLFDVRVAYALQTIGAGLGDRAVGAPTKVPHSLTDEIRDKVAQEGWYPGAPTLEKLRQMDGLHVKELPLDEEAEEAHALFVQRMKNYRQHTKQIQLSYLQERIRKETKKRRLTPRTG